jgi:hypothetical protein
MSGFTEHPVFVPLDDEFIAAVLTVPDDTPRGLVVLLTGVGATRSHRFQVWTRTARRLAEDKALASIRLDYLGVGDSTAEIRAWTQQNIPTREAVAAALFGMQALGVDRVASSGNCIGSWASLGMADAVPGWLGAALIRMPLLDGGAMTAVRRRAGRSGLFRTTIKVLRSNAFIRRRILRRMADATRRAYVPTRTLFPRGLARGDLLFLWGEDDYTFSRKVRPVLRDLAKAVPKDRRDAYEVRVVAGRSLQGFDAVPSQDLVVDTLAEWFDQLFATKPQDTSPVMAEV